MRLGPGLRQDLTALDADDVAAIVSTKCGVLQNDKANSFFVNTNQKRVCLCVFVKHRAFIFTGHTQVT